MTVEVAKENTYKFPSLTTDSFNMKLPRQVARNMILKRLYTFKRETI